MRLVFMGTPDFAVPTLDALVGAGHEILAVVAQPDRPKGRGKKLQSPATVQRARALGLPVRQPRAVRSGPFVDWMTTIGADAAVVVAYGRILIPQLLDAPRLGCINVHASILPRYRGAAPIQWAVVRGESETGVCTMQMAEGLDTGDVLMEERTPIGPDETAGDVHDRLVHMGARLAVETLAQLEDIVPTPQDHAAHTLAPLITRDDARIDWTQPAEVVHNLVRGFNPWPVGWTGLGGERLKVWRTGVVPGDGASGTVIDTTGGIVVACGAGAVELMEVQLPGKRKQAGRDLVNAGRIQEGTVLE